MCLLTCVSYLCTQVIVDRPSHVTVCMCACVCQTVETGDSRPSDDSNPTPTHKPPKTPLHTAASDASDVLSGCDSADLSAPHSGSWLHASLHYTGYELEQKAQSVKVSMHVLGPVT